MLKIIFGLIAIGAFLALHPPGLENLDLKFAYNPYEAYLWVSLLSKTGRLSYALHQSTNFLFIALYLGLIFRLVSRPLPNWGWIALMLPGIFDSIESFALISACVFHTGDLNRWHLLASAANPMKWITAVTTTIAVIALNWGRFGKTLWSICGTKIPQIELVKIKSIDFFPSQPTASQLAAWKSICVGAKTRTLGDALMLSHLPRLLKQKYPHLSVSFYPRAFNPVVYLNNPYTDGPDYLPDAVFGDDCNWGSGHLLQLKESYFGLPITPSPKPEIYLNDEERQLGAAWIKQAIPNRSKPICILHPWGHTWTNVADQKFWRDLVNRFSGQFHFCQVGLVGHSIIPECDAHLLTPKARHEARLLFAVISQSQAFIGVNSGPMHIAKAFDLPSTILTQEGNAEHWLNQRRNYPYFLHGNWSRAFLYDSNRHIDVKTENALELSSEFLSRIAKL